MSDNKLRLYANVNTVLPGKVLASALGIPPVEKRQPDLQYITAVFVSSGFNLNSAYFLPSELVMAKDTVVEKPLDLEHEQEKIVGHMYSSVFAYKDGTTFDPMELSSTLGNDVDKVPMDIIAAMRLYKARFPQVASDVDSGKYKVSMECYYRDFDIIVDNLVIPKKEAQAIGLVDVINNIVTVTDGTASKGKHRVGRVLRGMLFSGCGLVENPANLESLILETAGYNDNYILDLTRIDSYMKAKQEKESIVIHSLEGSAKDLAYLSASYGGSHEHDVSADNSETFLDGTHTHLVVPSYLPEGTFVYFVSDGAHKHPFVSNKGTIGAEKEHTHKVYVEKRHGSYSVVESSAPVSIHSHEVLKVDVDESGEHDDNKPMSTRSSMKRGSLLCQTGYGGVHHHVVILEDGTKLKTVTPSDIIKMEKEMKDDEKIESAGTGNADGHPLSTPELCVSYKRHVYSKGGDNPGVPANADKTPGLVPQVESLPAPSGGGAGETITQQDTLVHENWCALFDSACTTPGGVAVHPECLRLVLDRTTEDVVSSYFEKLQINRKVLDVKKALSSLRKILEK